MEKLTIVQLREMMDVTRAREKDEVQEMYDYVSMHGGRPTKGEHIGGIENGQPYLTWWCTTDYGSKPVRLVWGVGGFCIHFADDFSEKVMDFFPGCVQVEMFIKDMMDRYNMADHN